MPSQSHVLKILEGKKEKKREKIAERQKDKSRKTVKYTETLRLCVEKHTELP